MRPLNSIVMREAQMRNSTSMRQMPVVLAAFLGLLTAFACVPLMGIAAAIPAPTAMFAWAKSHGILELAVLLWGTLVVGAIGVGAPAVVSLLVLLRTFRDRRVVLAATFSAALIFGLYVVVPFTYFEPLDIPSFKQWWSLGKEFALGIVLAGALLSAGRHA